MHVYYFFRNSIGYAGMIKKVKYKGFHMLKFGPDVKEGLKFHLEQKKKSE